MENLKSILDLSRVKELELSQATEADGNFLFLNEIFKECTQL